MEEIANLTGEGKLANIGMEASVVSVKEISRKGNPLFPKLLNETEEERS
jgi:hypothetical protein